MSFNVDHSKSSRKKKTTETKETYAQSITITFYVYFPLCLIYNTHLLSLLPPPSQDVCSLRSILKSLFQNKKLNRTDRLTGRSFFAISQDRYIATTQSSIIAVLVFYVQLLYAYHTEDTDTINSARVHDQLLLYMT